MKKAAKTLAITATALLVLTFLTTLITLVLYFIVSADQVFTFGNLWYTVRSSNILSVGALAFIGALLCLTLCSKKIGWWNELIAIVAILLTDVILPTCIDLLLFVFDRRLYLAGVDSYYLFSGVQSMSSLVDIACPLLLVACGISIIFKHANRKNLAKERSV